MVVLSVFEMTYRIESVRLSHKMQHELTVEKQNHRCNKKHIAKIFHHRDLKNIIHQLIKSMQGLFSLTKKTSKELRK